MKVFFKLLSLGLSIYILNMDKCQECSRNADLTCSCNFKLYFCSVHFVMHLKSPGNHEGLPLEDEITKSTKFLIGKIKELDELKTKVHSKSNFIIETISKKTSSLIKKIEEKESIMRYAIQAQDVFSLKTLEEYMHADFNEFTEYIENSLKYFFNVDLESAIVKPVRGTVNLKTDIDKII